MRISCRRAWSVHDQRQGFPAAFRVSFVYAYRSRISSCRRQTRQCLSAGCRMVTNASHNAGGPMPAEGKTVAIVGAGPAGLVSARHLLAAGLQPYIFDRQVSVGGLWSHSSQILWDSLTTNLSRHTCSFSDWPWPPHSAMFPSKEDMGLYLQSFTDQFLTDGCSFELNSDVTRVRRVTGSAHKWAVDWTDSEGQQREQDFDHVVIASGFFSQPHSPPIPGLPSFPGPIVHSGRYRNPTAFSNQRVAVVGASISAVEIAAEVATVAKSVIHITPHPCWLLPRHLPWDHEDPASPFVPLDWVLYRRSRSQELGAGADELHEQHIGAERNGDEERKWALLHDWFSSVCGDQGTSVAPGLRVAKDRPPYVAISDTYSTFVRDGKIQVVTGRLQQVQGSTLVMEDESSVEEVDAIILCSGYQPHLPFLSEETLSTLSYSPTDTFMPLLLHRSVFHPQVPGLAFVGMYRGQYLAVAELQARWVAAVFSGALPPPSDAQQRDGIEEAGRLRAQQPRPQFPYPDYISLADGLAAELDMLPSADWMKARDVVLAAHYSGCERVREAAVRDWEEDMKAYNAGRAVAGIVFRALQGRWSMTRDIVSRLPSLPSGAVVGSATFHLASSTADEYLYSEEGEFTLPNGQRMGVRKKYVYKYASKEDRIDVHFAPGDASSKGFFHALRFLRGDRQGSEYGWKAAGDHLCVKDMYETCYRFAFKGIQLVKFEVQHEVRGPQKDYTSTTVFSKAG